MDLPVINVRWSAPVGCQGADASPIPARGGVYELLWQTEDGVERMFVGETEDLRRTFVSHIAGSKGSADLRRTLNANDTSYRYWLCESYSRRQEAVAALADLHFYECGSSGFDDTVSCVRLVEVE